MALLQAAALERGPLSIMVPCSGRMRYVYSAVGGGGNERRERELHRVYDFALNLSTVPADGVSLVIALETEGIGPLEQRLLRASLLLCNTVVLCDLIDVQHGWRVDRSQDRYTELVWLVFSTHGYLPLSPFASAQPQFTVRICTNDKLGLRYNLRVYPLYFRASAAPPAFAPQSQHLLQFDRLPTPVILNVDAGGQRWSAVAYGVSEKEPVWRPFHEGYSTYRPVRPSPQQLHPPPQPQSRSQPHAQPVVRGALAQGPQRPFEQVKPTVAGAYTSFGWQPTTSPAPATPAASAEYDPSDPYTSADYHPPAIP